MATVRYWAGAKAAAGTAQEQVDAPTVGAALAELRDRHDTAFAAVLDRCSLLLDGTQAADPTQALGPDSVLDCLPPFAGG